MAIRKQWVSFMVFMGLISPVLGAQSEPGNNRVSEQTLAGASTSQSAKGQAVPTAGNSAVQSLLKTSFGRGYMEPAEVKKLMDQVRFAEYRINDLLTDVNPQRWKMSDTGRASFQETLRTLRTQMDSLKKWRSLFQDRPESSYLAFETYAAMNAVLPRLEGVARNVSELDNPSYGVQFSQSGDRLFDLQQNLGAYVDFLLQIQDQIQLALENNLAGCQRDLGQAMRVRAQRAKSIRNLPALRPARRAPR